MAMDPPSLENTPRRGSGKLAADPCDLSLLGQRPGRATRVRVEPLERVIREHSVTLHHRASRARPAGVQTSRLNAPFACCASAQCQATRFRLKPSGTDDSRAFSDSASSCFKSASAGVQTSRLNASFACCASAQCQATRFRLKVEPMIRRAVTLHHRPWKMHPEGEAPI